LKRKVAYIVFLVILFNSRLPAFSQDPAFSQFYANSLYMNPALAGIEGPAKLYIGYRNQWPGSTDSYITYHASYEQYVKVLHGGIGIHLMNDRQGGGIFNTASLDAMYAYHLKVSRKLTLSGGLQASAGQRTLNPGSLVFADMIDPSTGNISGSPVELIGSYRKIYPDFSTGMAAFYGNFFGGFAVHHLHMPYVSATGDPDTRLARRYTVHVGAMIPIHERRLGKELLQLSPHLIYMQQLSYQQINYGMEVIFRNLIGGIWVRQDLLLSSGTLIFSVGYGTDQFRFRYSYDARLNRPDINIPNMGAHELSLIVLFHQLNKTDKHRAIKCPKI